MTDPKRPNAAWKAAHQWRRRATQTRPTGLLGTIKLFFTWLAFGILLMVAAVLGLLFMLVGWAMLPLVRHRMKRHLDSMRAHQAEDIGAGTPSSRSGESIEGHYQLKEDSIKPNHDEEVSRKP